MSNVWQNGRVHFSFCHYTRSQNTKDFTQNVAFLCTRTENLQLTDELIGNLDDRTHNEETSKDIRRIQELLTSPENTNER